MTRHIVKEFVLRSWDPKEKIASIRLADGSPKINDAVLVYPSLSEIINPTVGDKGLVLILPSGKAYILGFIFNYDASGKYKSDNKTFEENCDKLADGERMFVGGLGSYIKLSRDATIEIFSSAFLKLLLDPNGQIAKIDAKNYSLRTLSASILSDGNVVWKFDDVTGAFSYHSEMRTTANDFYPKFTLDIAPPLKSGEKSNIIFKYDNGPSAVPQVTPFLPILSTIIRLGAQTNGVVFQISINSILDITLNNFGEVEVSTLKGLTNIKLDKTGNITAKATAGQIKMTPAGNIELSSPGGKINLSPAGDIELTSPGGKINLTPTGNIEASNPVGKMNLSPAGNIELSSPGGKINLSPAGGIKLKGNAGEVLQIVSTFMQLFMTHIHPTGTGPSGPAVTVNPQVLVEKGKLDIIRKA